MKNKFILLIVLLSLVFFKCNKEDDEKISPTGEFVTYDLVTKNGSEIKGKVTFIENSDTSTTIDIEILKTSLIEQYSVYIYFNTAIEEGDIAISLGLVDGNTGKSSVTISELDSGSQISYDNLINFDGHINVYSSVDNLTTFIAQADIGQNKLTGNNLKYDLDAGYFSVITGRVTFFERKNGEVLAETKLFNTSSNSPFPAHIYSNKVTEGGEILSSFEPLNGNTAMSFTNVKYLDNGNSFLYNDILNLNGHVKIHLGGDELNTVLAQGNIGLNK